MAVAVAVLVGVGGCVAVAVAGAVAVGLGSSVGLVGGTVVGTAGAVLVLVAAGIVGVRCGVTVGSDSPFVGPEHATMTTATSRMRKRFTIMGKSLSGSGTNQSQHATD
ncbi:MAG: hypothetical protein DCC58_00770 [Chloroflexi bacterium]|nr:MAG: hypothetical protein DCC58_00770 [Chloroflexota bacterium]